MDVPNLLQQFMLTRNVKMHDCWHGHCVSETGPMDHDLVGQQANGPGSAPIRSSEAGKADHSSLCEVSRQPLRLASDRSFQQLTEDCISMTSTPQWLTELANEALASVLAIDLLAPVGCHHYHNKAIDEWEVSLFASTTEIVGGQRDGERCSSKFLLDLKSLVQIFDSVQNLHWQALSLDSDDELGPHISLEGIYRGHKVWLRVLSTAPERFQSGRRASVYSLRLEEIW